MPFYAVYRIADSSLVSIGEIVGSEPRDAAGLGVLPAGLSATVVPKPDLGVVQWNPATLSFVAKPAVVSPSAALQAKANAAWTLADVAAALKLILPP